MNPKQTTKLSALIPSPLVDGLRDLARENDRSVSAEVRSAVRAHVGARGEAPPPSTPSDPGRDADGGATVTSRPGTPGGEAA
jgi:hypothetical protein